MGRKEDAARKAKAKAKANAKTGGEVGVSAEDLENQIGSKRSQVLQTAVVTGVLASQEQAMDVKIEQFSLSIFGVELICDTKLELNFARRYGLIGANGSGKSTMLAALAAREVPIPKHIDIWFLDSEAKPEEVTAVQAVVNVVLK